MDLRDYTNQLYHQYNTKIKPWKHFYNTTELVTVISLWRIKTETYSKWKLDHSSSMFQVEAQTQLCGKSGKWGESVPHKFWEIIE